MDTRLPRSLVFALSLAGAGCASARSTPVPSGPAENQRQASAPATESRDESPSVEDVRPSDGRDSPYDRCVRRVLLDSIDSRAMTMICEPSFRSEYAVALVPPAQVEIHPDVWEQPDAPWTIVVAKAAMWSKDWRADWDALGPADFQVARTSIPLDRETALELEGAWRMVVRRARHPRPTYANHGGRRFEVRPALRTDGERYEFDADGFSGMSHSPGAGPARDLIALLDRVASAASILSEAERAAVLRQCAEQARALEERAENLPW